MNRIYPLFAVLMAVSISSWAQDRVGNGGGLWICESDQGNVFSGMLVDLFESRNEHQLQTLFTPHVDPVLIYRDRFEFLNRIYPEFSRVLRPFFEKVDQKRTLVDVELISIDDSLYITRPLQASCVGGNWKYAQFANFTHDGRILISRTYWESSNIAAIDKGALLVHEAIYFYLRHQFGDKDSRRARLITGILFSTLLPQEMIPRIQSVINKGSVAPTPPTTVAPAQPSSDVGWVCSIRHTGDHWLYATWDHRSQTLGRLSIHKFCEDQYVNSHVNFRKLCDQKSIRCDSYKRTEINLERYVCLTRHKGDQVSFVKFGSTKFIAELNSISACESAYRNSHVTMRRYCELIECGLADN